MELFCWEENDGSKKWEMIKKEDFPVFLLNMFKNADVKKHTVFCIPIFSIFSGIWLFDKTHESGRVDFYHFFEDYGEEYQTPEINEEDTEIIKKTQVKNDPDTKYGWISPDGKYFHCNYQGHIDLADRICFGMVETDNAEYYLEEHGWCKIYKSLFEDNYCVYVGGKYTITDAQMKTLIDLGLDHAEDLSKMLNKSEE